MAQPQPAPRHQPPEPPDQRRDRQLGVLRRLTDLNMIAAEAAAALVQTATTPEEIAQPVLALSRATRAVTTIINTENRVAAGLLAPEPRLAADDPRREDTRSESVRAVLFPLVKAHDPAKRRARRQQVGDAIDAAIEADPRPGNAPAHYAQIVAEQFNLDFDLGDVSDEFLGMPRRPRLPPNGQGNEPKPFHDTT